MSNKNPKRLVKRPEMSFMEGMARYGGDPEETFAGELARRQILGEISPEEAEEMIQLQAEATENMFKGIAIAPVTAPPELLAMSAQLMNWSAREMNERAFKLPDEYVFQYGPELTELNGDWARDAIGIPQGDPAAMMGEMLPLGWEGAIAKAPAMGAKLYNAALSVAPEKVAAAIAAWKLFNAKPKPGQVNSLFGALGASRIEDINPNAALRETAEARYAQGENPATVFGETGWYKDPTDGKLKLLRPDGVMQIKMTPISDHIKQVQAGGGFGEVGSTTVVTRPAREFLDDPELFAAYPELADAPISISVRRAPDREGKTAYEMIDPNKAEAGVFGELVDGHSINVYKADSIDGLKATVTHEIQHWIQNYEGFTRGNSTQWLQSKANAYLDAVRERDLLLAHNAGEIPKKPADKLEWLADTLESRHGTNWEPGELEQLQADLIRIEGMNPDVLDMYLFEAEVFVDSTTKDVLEYFRLGSQDELVEFLMKNPNQVDLYDRAAAVYRNTGGEVEARLSEFLRNRNFDEVMDVLRARGETPMDLARRMPDPLETAQPLPSPIKEGGTVAQEGARLRLVPELPEGVDPKDYEFLQNLLDRDPQILSKLADSLKALD